MGVLGWLFYDYLQYGIMTVISGFRSDCASKLTRKAGRLSSWLQNTLLNSENRFIGSYDVFKVSNIKKSL